MAKLTLWESICRRAGPEFDQEVSIPEAVGESAVTPGVAEAEIKLLVEEELVEMIGADALRLTSEGRRSAVDVHHSQIRADL